MIGAPRVRRQRGTTLVEQALVLVFLLTILFAIIDFGRMLYVYHFVANQAREGARWASVRSNNSQTLPHAGQGSLKTFVTNIPAGMGLDPAKITPNIAWVTPPNGAPGCVNVNDVGCSVRVTVSYAYTPLFPVAFLPSSVLTMTSTSEMVITQ
jgi:Flp pilus assembly protein TadG